jgi:hypothetical protein
LTRATAPPCSCRDQALLDLQVQIGQQFALHALRQRLVNVRFTAIVEPAVHIAQQRFAQRGARRVVGSVFPGRHGFNFGNGGSPGLSHANVGLSGWNNTREPLSYAKTTTRTVGSGD